MDSHVEELPVFNLVSVLEGRIGNEGSGIDAQCAANITRRLFIPPYPTDRRSCESLNVAIATAVICSEFRRRQ